jgi:hypothetical protein
MNTPFFLEILNGGLVTPDLIWLVLLGIYLSKESRRRGLHWFDWFHLPASMNLMLAFFITDAAIVTRSWVVWAWRRFDGGGDFAAWHFTALIITGFFVLVGTLCKIRAWTHPHYGNWPWLVSAVATILGIIVLVVV